MSKMTRARWRQTPYAGTTAGRTQAEVGTLLARYGVKTHQWTEQADGTATAVVLRFVLKDRPYRVAVRTLDADADRESLARQARRALYHYLKSALEMVNLFFTAEEVLAGFAEVDDGRGGLATVAEMLAGGVPLLERKD